MSTAKRRKTSVLDMRGAHHVTARALADVAKYVRENGLPDATSRSAVYRERKKAMDRITPFGPLVQMRPVPKKGGGTMDIPFQHPLAMLYICIKDSHEFATFFWDVVNRLQGKPLRLVEYSDEIVPGRELIAYNDKKVWALYWSVLDFGPKVLANEDSWLTGPCFLCSTIVLYLFCFCSSC